MSLHPMFFVALAWCEQHPKWQRICDISDSDAMKLRWDELPKSIQQPYEKYHDPEAHWQEFANKPYRHRYGFVGEDRRFYDEITEVPRLVNSVMVFETGGRPGTFYHGGMKQKSGVKTKT